MKGVAPRLDASDTHNVVSLDDLSVEDVHTAKLGVLSLPTAEAAESEAGTHTNNKVTSATKKKRKRELSAIRSKCAKMHKRGFTPGAIIKMHKKSKRTAQISNVSSFLGRRRRMNNTRFLCYRSLPHNGVTQTSASDPGLWSARNLDGCSCLSKRNFGTIRPSQTRAQHVRICVQRLN